MLPPKFEGGLLIFLLYEKISTGELDLSFSTVDIKNALIEISNINHIEIPQTERIIKSLLNYFLRHHPDQPGEYHLTDFAESLVEMVNRKLNNPYKSLKLKESFEKYFSIRHNEIRSADDMETKFGKEFIEGHKNIIRHHLDSLDEEMQEAYLKLRDILHAEETDATKMVSNFALTFKKFGERAEDINHAIAQKDRFLRDLRRITDNFYNDYISFPIPLTEQGRSESEKLAKDWRRCAEIYQEIEFFFTTIDKKIANINRQIYYASGKLTELQENFSARAKMKLAVKLLLKLSLDYARGSRDEVIFDKRFPIRGHVHEPQRFFTPGRHEFLPERESNVIEQDDDAEYAEEVARELDIELDRDEKIQHWIEFGKELITQESITMSSFMDQIMKSENDLIIAYKVASEIMEYANENGFDITIEQNLVKLSNEEIYLWKTNLKQIKTTDF